MEAFRAYAAHTRTPEFLAALDDLAADVAARTATVIKCSESVWWRCHRRLIADDFTARGWRVQHIMAPGKLQLHELNADARMQGDHLVYPPTQPQLL